MRKMFTRFTGLGALAAAALALGATAAAVPASATTQHWAGASQVPYGSSQEFSGEATGEWQFTWDYGSIRETIVCTSLATSGTAGNPVGGGAGTVNSKSLQLGNCGIEGHEVECAIKNGQINLSPFSETTASSGEDRVQGAPYRSTLEVSHRQGYECFFEGNYVIWSAISAEPVSGAPGEYQIDSDESWIGFEEYPSFSLTLDHGRFSLSTPSSEALVLSSGASQGAAHWYLGSATWSNLSAGKATGFQSSGPVSLEIDAEVFGAALEVTCEGSANGIEGSLENPSGGGAGTSSATFTFGECSVPPVGQDKDCVVTPIKWSLSGVATQIGKEGSPAVEMLPEGAEAATFEIRNKIGTYGCNVAGDYELEGSLIAISEGDGRFSLGAPEAILNGFFPATVGGGFALEGEAGESLRLQA